MIQWLVKMYWKSCERKILQFLSISWSKFGKGRTSSFRTDDVRRYTSILNLVPPDTKYSCLSDSFLPSSIYFVFVTWRTISEKCFLYVHLINFMRVYGRQIMKWKERDASADDLVKGIYLLWTVGTLKDTQKISLPEKLDKFLDQERNRDVTIQS
jgi:hypothetical protein